MDHLVKAAITPRAIDVHLNGVDPDDACSWPQRLAQSTGESPATASNIEG